MTETRYALIRTKHGEDEVKPYLPANYQVIGTQPVSATEGINVIIAGTDNAGWTMSDYVLPRLGSGLISGREITEAEAREVVPAPTEADLDAAWADAYGIAVTGASNPKGVAYTLDNLIRNHHVPVNHPAIRAIEGHLDYLNGNGLGPEMDDFREVEANARRLGITDDEGKYVPVSDRPARTRHEHYGKCDTIGCKGGADETISYTFRGEQATGTVCTPCADSYERRPAFRNFRRVPVPAASCCTDCS